MPNWEHWVPVWSWLLGDIGGLGIANSLIYKFSANLGFCLHKTTESFEIILTPQFVVRLEGFVAVTLLRMKTLFVSKVLF